MVNKTNNNGTLKNTITGGIRNTLGYDINTNRPVFIVKWAFAFLIIALGVVITAAWLIKQPVFIRIDGAVITAGAHCDSVYLQIDNDKYDLTKIHSNLPVQLSFNDFPADSLGYVQGKLVAIKNVGNKQQLHLRLSQGLITNKQFQIPCRPGLRATAVIIKDLRLLQHLRYSSMHK